MCDSEVNDRRQGLPLLAGGRNPGGNSREDHIQRATDGIDDRDDRDNNRGGNQAVFDRSTAGVVLC